MKKMKNNTEANFLSNTFSDSGAKRLAAGTISLKY